MVRQIGDTCRMGSLNRQVVDPQLRVRGIKDLRVIDASIIPELPNANSHAAAVMIGELGAQMILGWTQQWWHVWIMGSGMSSEK